MARQVLPLADGQMLTAAVALSMILTPFLAELGRLFAGRLRRPSAGSLVALREEYRRSDRPCRRRRLRPGGQTVAKVLADDVPYVALDLDARRIARARAKGLPVFYGDAGRVNVLAAAGAGRARAAVLTIDQPPVVDRVVSALHSHFPELRIFVRGRDPEHGTQLIGSGATAVVPEVVEASLQLGVLVLDALGAGAEGAARAADELRRDNYVALREITGGDVQERGA